MSIQRDIFVIMTTHNPEDIFKESFNSILRQSRVGTISIVDNSDDGGSFVKECINKYASKEIDILFTHVQPTSLAYALNLNREIAIRSSLPYVLIMEDDAVLTKDLDDVILKYPMGEFDILVLNRLEKAAPNEMFRVKQHAKGKVYGSFICLFNTKILYKIKFREEFVMDQVDIDFQLRAIKMGGKVLLTKEQCVFSLPVGRVTSRGINTISPYRYYLLVRNSTVLYKEGQLSFFHCVKYDLGYFLKISYTFSVKSALVSLIRGVKDAMNNKLF
ncbi:MAG: hypothetical protein QW292_10225 [Candidatus Parvarchaeota archaeon]